MISCPLNNRTFPSSRLTRILSHGYAEWNNSLPQSFLPLHSRSMQRFSLITQCLSFLVFHSALNARLSSLSIQRSALVIIVQCFFSSSSVVSAVAQYTDNTHEYQNITCTERPRKKRPSPHISPAARLRKKYFFME